MHVLSVVFVVVYVGQVCQGALLHQGHTSLLRRTFRGSTSSHPGDSVTHRELKDNNLIALKKYLRTVIKDKKIKYKTTGETHTQTGSGEPHEHRARLSESVPVSLTANKLPSIPRRPPNHSLKEAESKAEGGRHALHHLRPWISHISPVQVPELIPCKSPRTHTPHIATAPPNVCDLCPDEDGKNPLDPCTVCNILHSSTHRKDSQGAWQC